MASWRSGSSLSRSLISAARSSSLRSPPPLPRFRPSPASAPRLQSRPFSFAAPSRTMGELGCIQSLLPLHSTVASVRLTSHLNVGVRACCELYHGTFSRSCPDR